MVDPTAKVDMASIQEGVAAARRALSQAHPEDSFLPLVIVLPVHRSLLARARAGHGPTDNALRESLRAIIDTIAWPE
jgi:hypothetical protein